MIEEEKYIKEEIAIRDHFLRQNEEAPDVKSELEKFMQTVDNRVERPHRWRMVALWTSVAAVAAVLILLVMAKPFDNDDKQKNGAVVAYRAESAVANEIMFQTGDAEPVAVTQQGLHKISEEAGKTTGLQSNSTSEVRMNSLRTPSNMTATFQLPDGTVVMLNSCSRLVYPERFAHDIRKVSVEGEAYFEVAKDADRPFVVESNGVYTKALGTQFNVRARKDSPEHVTLVDGAVEVKTANGETCRLKPGDDAEIDNGKIVGVTQPDMEIFTAWRQGEFYFDNVSLGEICAEIGRWYNVSVIFNTPEIMNTKLFFVADRYSSINEVVNLLNALDKAKISFDDNQIVIE